METEPAGKKKGNVVSVGTTAPGLIKDGRVSVGTWKSPAKTVSVGTGVRQPKFFLSFQDLGSYKIQNFRDSLDLVYNNDYANSSTTGNGDTDFGREFFKIQKRL